MPLHHEAANDFHTSLSAADTLLAFAKTEEQKGGDENRVLFLKLAIVLMVTRFQVFVESILKEFHYLLRENNIKFQKLPFHFRLNAIRLHSEDFIISKRLSNRESYNQQKFENVKNHIEKMRSHFIDSSVEDLFLVQTKFPLGKTGQKELVDLFSQIEGKNIFESSAIDLNILDSILLLRHLIIHQDRASELTDGKTIEYLRYLKDLGMFIDQYLHDMLGSFQ